MKQDFVNIFDVVNIFDIVFFPIMKSRYMTVKFALRMLNKVKARFYAPLNVETVLAKILGKRIIKRNFKNIFILKIYISHLNILSRCCLMANAYSFVIVLFE